MAIRSVLANDSLYHIYNRGADKREIFLDETDCLRFMRNLYDFNDVRPFEKGTDFGLKIKEKERELLVDILCYCLMPNHFHLILRQRQDDGITRFMRKIGTGYGLYFNIKNERSGVLFQGRFKGKHIENDEYFIHLSRYIHLNPVDLVKDDKVNQKEFLKSYQWSSYQTYIGMDNFPSVINTDLLSGMFPKAFEYENFVYSLVSSRDEIGHLMLD